MINPSAYLPAADGLYLLSHHLENMDANAIMKNEFKIENHETVISASGAEKSLFNIQIAIPHTPRKQTMRTILEMAIFLKVCFPSKTNTHVIIARGIMVRAALKNIINELRVTCECSVPHCHVQNNTNEDATLLKTHPEEDCKEGKI